MAKRAYLDANVLIAYTMGPEKEPKQFPLADSVFRSVAQGKYVGAITYLTLMEVLGAFRRVKAEELDVLNSMQEQQRTDYVINESNKLYQSVVGYILKTPELRIVQGKNIDFSRILVEGLTILQSIRGAAKIYNNCSKCGSNLPNSTHKGVGAMDLVHALLAKELKCDVLITLDKWFKEIKAHKSVEPLEIIVLEL